MDYLQALNPSQRQAVETINGPLLVIAGAGSGKTRVLTYRIAHLIQAHKVPPYRILAVTFTNKAAQEMQERIMDLVGPAAADVWMGTFHSICVRILRADGHRLGYRSNFQIFDTVDQTAVVRECLVELNLDSKRFDPSSILASISRAKDSLLSPAQYSEAAADFWEKKVAQVYGKYQAKLEKSNAVDFDDLIRLTVMLLDNYPEVLEKYQNRFSYILVDEYQDTNHAQYKLVHLLASGHGNLCVVGDEDQSIYAFRGADIRNILEFERDFPQAKVIKLEENYRSTKRILDAANSVIAHNTSRKPKQLWTSNPPGEEVVFFQGDSEREEAAFIAEQINRLVQEKGYQLADFAVLYRTHAQSRVLEEEFMRRGTAYRIVSGLRFYERKEIKDILAYLRLCYNPDDDYSFMRVVNCPRRGIGDATLAKVADFAASRGLSLFASIDHLHEVSGLSGRTKAALSEFCNLIKAGAFAVETVGITGLTELLLRDSGYLEMLRQQRDEQAPARLENLNEFLSVTQQFEKESSGADLGAFLEHVALISDVDNYDREANVVNLMTLHAAKGLEFPVVFMCGMEDGIFPHSRALWEPGQIEEERRLAYVGMTRARERLFLTCARVRTIFGTTGQNPVSQFIKEIDAGLIRDFRSLDRPPQAAPLRDDQRGVTAAQDYKAGDRVRHRIWGEGLVVAVKGSVGDLQLSIAFPDKGIKTVLAHLAPIEKL
ncbi:MAG: DNA helicase PcrA [Firmicutes bacterium]|jgi:DNA helicase-2/ATP-dependent DNA helicase PcrA|nr:DNA helicase PcrA [Bacillota bacterium]